MAVSSTTAALYISRKDFSTQTPINGAIPTNSIAFATKLRRFHIRSSGELSADTSATEADSSENPIEALKEPPSLISALNVERALRGIPITDVDYYGRLGLQRGCSSEQVIVAYQRKVEEMRNQGLNEEELDNKLELLKESYIILSSEEERRMYDWSLARSQDVETYVWPFEVDKTKTPKESPPMQDPEDVGPTRLVGYFILGWLILSFIVSIALNQ
ncbi:NAD(P)H-quinone oxidoreductase subunit U, chloroplastic [Corylus avellana]|uniref:NAD(P)H-quinone oxidoreductase subunit U, chloroplastic n=1 Tax=Corylus avellana TaxID=13451 RepID=UPI001E22C8CF|nr:NAD(P)H-quinone oxidoreductase subunit U, chloroplastic [Corylus avellana]